MKVTYIFHSCFLLETADCALVIDYFKDTAKKDGVLQNFLTQTDKQVYIMATHAHGDHYTPAVYQFVSKKPLQYIFSKDIPDMNKQNVAFLQKGEEYKDSRLYVKAYGSTDEGISFYIEVEGKKIFHAGDLNNWHWNEEVDAEEAQGYEDFFARELQDLTKDVQVVDLLLFPVDPRLGRDYQKGAMQIVDAIDVKAFGPMHFGNHYEKANGFESYARQKGVRFLAITEKGQSWTIE